MNEATTITTNVNALARKHVCGVKSVRELVEKQAQHGYVPSLLVNHTKGDERAELTLLADAYDRQAARRGLRPCWRGL